MFCCFWLWSISVTMSRSHRQLIKQGCEDLRTLSTISQFWDSLIIFFFLNPHLRTFFFHCFRERGRERETLIDCLLVHALIGDGTCYLVPRPWKWEKNQHSCCLSQTKPNEQRQGLNLYGRFIQMASDLIRWRVHTLTDHLKFHVKMALFIRRTKWR